MEYISSKIAQGIELICVSADRFKTNEISISLSTSLKKETASRNALLSSLLTRCSEKYENLTALNKKLAYLYGATVEGTVSKVGESQVVKLGITSIDDRFSLDNDSISNECLSLLLSLLLEPKVKDGAFYQEDIELEKRILKEKLEAEDNEKRIYSLRKAEEIMFEDEPYSINRFGSQKDIDMITKENAFEAYQNLLIDSKILITIVGSSNLNETEEILKNAFKDVKRNITEPIKSVFIPKADTVKEVEERLDIKQGKLVLGFRVDLKPDDELTTAMRSFNDIFGGAPYSKLFMNVREKLSLCYYCSARYIRQKSAIIIQCGCEEENMDKAVEEIKKQLKEIQSGNIDSELTSSKIGISDVLMSIYDSPEMLEAWYTSQIIDNEMTTPSDSSKKNEEVTKDDIIKCSNLLTLDTVFKLLSTKEEN